MDTSRIDDFISIMYTVSFDKKVLDIIKTGGNLHEYQKGIYQKRKDFESCVIDLCLKYGDNTDKALLIYRNRLVDCQELQENRRERPKMYAQMYEEYTDKELASLDVFFSFIIKLISKEIMFIDKITNKEENVVNTPTYAKKQKMQNTSDVYYATNHTNKKLRRVYNYLIDNGHLEKDNLLSDFLYYFTGKGEKVNNILKWSTKYRAKVDLAFFLVAIVGGDRSAECWNKAKTIFGVTGLAQSYNQAPETSISERKISKDVLDLLK